MMLRCISETKSFLYVSNSIEYVEHVYNMKDDHAFVVTPYCRLLHPKAELLRDEYSVRVLAGPCRLSFFKIWPFSEAICETAGSMMNQHCGKNRFLQPENFNIEMYLKFNLGPLHLLDNFVKEILASDSTKSYLRKEQTKISRLVTNDLNKSAAMETIEKRIEKKSRFPTSFWQDTYF